MLGPEKNIRGFNLLELLVVVALIGVLSAAAYPNFQSWKKDRQVRQAVLKVKSLISGINTQVQRGAYTYVQFEIKPEDDYVTFNTRGLSAAQVGLKKIESSLWQVGESNSAKCVIDDTSADYWEPDISISDTSPDDTVDTSPDDTVDTSPDVTVDTSPDVTVDISPDVTVDTSPDVTVDTSPDDTVDTSPDETGTGTIAFYQSDDITVDIPAVAAVCFSKDDTYYGTNGLESGSFHICPRSESDSVCSISVATGLPSDEASLDVQKNLFRISWSRFGAVIIEKYNTGDENWYSQ